MILTPHGRLLPDKEELDSKLDAAFARGTGHGLLYLGSAALQTALPPEMVYWRDFSSRYVEAVRIAAPPIPPPASKDLDQLVLSAPPMKGAEYLTPAVLESLWHGIDAAFRIELAEAKTSIEDFLKKRNPAWNLVGRVHFNLAENRTDPELPFAFLATYTHRLGANAKAQHLPLGAAL